MSAERSGSISSTFTPLPLSTSRLLRPDIKNPPRPSGTPPRRGPSPYLPHVCNPLLGGVPEGRGGFPSHAAHNSGEPDWRLTRCGTTHTHPSPCIRLNSSPAPATRAEHPLYTIGRHAKRIRWGKRHTFSRSFRAADAESDRAIRSGARLPPGKTERPGPPPTPPFRVPCFAQTLRRASAKERGEPRRGLGWASPRAPNRHPIL